MKVFEGSTDKDYLRYIIRNNEIDKNNSIFEFVESNLEKYLPYADPKFEYNLSLDFWAHLWEMNLVIFFLEQGIEIIRKKTSEGPDIRIKYCNKYVNIELVCPKISSDETRQEIHSLADMKKSANYGVIFTKIEPEKTELRIESVIERKKNKFQEYLNKSTINQSDINIIAVSAVRLPFASCDFLYGFEINIIRSILPIGNEKVSINLDNNEICFDSFEPKNCNVNKNRSPVSKDIFNDDRVVSNS